MINNGRSTSASLLKLCNWRTTKRLMKTSKTTAYALNTHTHEYSVEFFRNGISRAALCVHWVRKCVGKLLWPRHVFHVRARFVFTCVFWMVVCWLSVNVQCEQLQRKWALDFRARKNGWMLANPNKHFLFSKFRIDWAAYIQIGCMLFGSFPNSISIDHRRIHIRHTHTHTPSHMCFHLNHNQL